MPSSNQLRTEYIPYEEDLYVQRFRTWLNDTPALNELLDIEESSNIYLYHCLTDTLDEINHQYLPITTYTTFSEFPSWDLLKTGATLKVLTGKGILSARNTLTYSDAGGVTVSDFDKYGRYINYFNVLINKFMRGISNLKTGLNIANCYGGVSSEYGIINAGPDGDLD